jgi:hypothetical protein
MKSVSKKPLPSSNSEQDTNPLASFEYISDVSDRIDQLVEEAENCHNRKEKREKFEEADHLARAYEKYCGRSNLFKTLI